MRIKKGILLLLSIILCISILGCSKNDEKTIKVGVSAVPHKDIMETIVPLLEEKGYKLDIQEFSDYVTPNTALQEGELDANYFQHIAYLNETNKSKGYDLVYTAAIHLEPMGLYSNKVNKVGSIEKGATIAIPNDPSNEARALRLLETAGLITLKEGELITTSDIIDNKYELKFTELEAAQLTRVLDEVDAAVINGNYALAANLDVNKDAIFIEDSDTDYIQDMKNVLAVKSGTENSDKIKVLTECLTSDEVRAYIEEKYKGTVIPVF